MRVQHLIDGRSVDSHDTLETVNPATQQVLAEIRRTLEPDALEYVPKIALVAVVGEGMSHAIGIAAKVFAALAAAEVNVRLINQGASELNIIVGVAPDDYPAAVRAIYGAFVP